MKKSTMVLGVAAATLLVTACHKNPLTGHDDKTSAKFLMSASKFAERKANRMISGTGYKQCMGENPTRFDCAKLFKDMTVFASTSKEFKGLTVADLKNMATFDKLLPAYDSELFNAV